MPPGVRGVGDPEGLQRAPLRCVAKTEAAVQQCSKPSAEGKGRGEPRSFELENSRLSFVKLTWEKQSEVSKKK